MSESPETVGPFAQTGGYAAGYDQLVAQQAAELNTSQDPEEMFPDEPSGLRKIAAMGLSAALAVGAAVSYGFEIGPWNEALRVDKGLDVLQATQNALAVGGTVAALTLAIEIVPGSLVALGLNRDSKLMNRVNGHIVQRYEKRLAEKAVKQEKKAEKLREREARIVESGTKPIDWLRQKTAFVPKALGAVANKGADVAIAFGGGSAMLVAKRHLTDPSHMNTKEGLKNAAKGTVWIAALSGLVGYLVAGGINYVSKVSFLETPANYVVEWGSSKTFWLKALGIGYGLVLGNKLLSKAKDGLKRRGEDQEDNEATIVPEQL